MKGKSLVVFNFFLEWIYLMTFNDMLIDMVSKVESEQDITVYDLIEELKKKLSGIMEGPLHEKS